MAYSISSLFSNSSSNSSVGFSSLAGLMQDYSSIRNGTYKKLLQKYYSINSTDNTSSSKTKTTKAYTIEQRMAEKNGSTSTDTSTSAETTKTLKDIRTATDDLKNSGNTLSKTGTGSVFTQVSAKDENGNITKEYDTDKIYSAVKDFVDNYNSVLDSTKDSKVSAIISNTNAMKNSTKANESALSSMGISIDKDGKLSIDEDTFKASDMSEVKSLFNGSNSYAAQTAARATSINTNAQLEQNKANTYTNSGYYSYNYSSGNIYNSYF